MHVVLLHTFLFLSLILRLRESLKLFTYMPNEVQMYSFLNASFYVLAKYEDYVCMLLIIQYPPSILVTKHFFFKYPVIYYLYF